MKKVTNSSIKNGIREGVYIEYTRDTPRPKHITKIAVSTGVYGISGGVFVDDETGIIYAIPSRSTALLSVF